MVIPAGRGLPWKGYEGHDYEGFWTGPGKHYLDQLEQAIVTDALPGGEAIVEIGAGFGRLGPCYIGRYRRVQMVEPASNPARPNHTEPAAASSAHDPAPRTACTTRTVATPSPNTR